MTRRIAFIRHGITDWNEAKRIQGQSDIALNDRGRRQVGGWRLPDLLIEPLVHSSPLGRCLETAAILGYVNPRIDDALMEMNWGSFEGRTLPALRDELGDKMSANERRGIDFQPPGGESPRLVARRLQHWLRQLEVGDHLVFTHKGVLRAAFSLALDWDMKNKLPFPLQRDALHLFHYDEDILILARENVPL